MRWSFAVGLPLVSAGLVCAGRYRLLDRLGEGGFGVVWAAQDERTGREVALKFLKATLALDSGVRQRFCREAQAACRVQHPNVVSIFDVALGDDDEPVIVMERLHGETLREALTRRRRLSLEELNELFVPVVSAVGAAHRAGIVHRDLKPENIFLCDGELVKSKVKLLDFSLAKIASNPLGSQSLCLTASGAMLGTPYYMSPEQVFGERDLDHRTDVWALGVISYECLSGARPTEAANAGQVFKRITTHDIAPLHQATASAPSELSLLVDRMLAADRGARPSMLELARFFERSGSLAVRRRTSRSPNALAKTVGAMILLCVLIGSIARYRPWAGRSLPAGPRAIAGRQEVSERAAPLDRARSGMTAVAANRAASAVIAGTPTRVPSVSPLRHAVLPGLATRHPLTIAPAPADSSTRSPPGGGLTVARAPDAFSDPL